MKYLKFCFLTLILVFFVVGIDIPSVYPIEPLRNFHNISIISMKMVKLNESWGFLRNIWDNNPIILNFYALGLLKDKFSMNRQLGAATLWNVGDFLQPELRVADCVYVPNNKIDEPLTYMIAFGCKPIHTTFLNEVLNDSVTLELRLLSITGPQMLFNASKTSSTKYISHGRFVTNIHKKYAKPSRSTRKNGVCAVQVFSNQLTGPRLYFFALYYIQLGWHVIIYDRYGRHESYLSELFRYSNLHYHPFTVLERIFPHIYNQTTAALEGNSIKYYFQRDIIKTAAGNSTALQSIETANQNSDKQKTYDYCRIEYQHLESILFLDSDEIFHCEVLKRYSTDQETPVFRHRDVLDVFFAIVRKRKYEEISIRRFNIYSLLWKSAHKNVSVVRSSLQLDASARLNSCILRAYSHRSLKDMFGCWSNQHKAGPLPKAIDVGSLCPFHWNHVMCKINTMENRSSIDHLHPRYVDNVYQCPCRVLDDDTSVYLPMNRDLKLKCYISHLAKYFHENRGTNPAEIYNYTSAFDRYRLPPGYVID